MHDLNTIVRRNAEAFAASIQNYRRQNRWVLAKYAGLHLESIETFTDQASAQVAFEAAMRDPSAARTVLFAPMPAPSDVTLGDYIARKSALLDNPKE